MVVADDEYIVIEGIKAIISRLELECEVVGFAYNGLDALEVIRKTMPDIVMLDIRMPGLDGLSLIETCREFLPEASYVIISGYTEFEYARRALTLGVISYIDKPITIAKVAEVIKLHIHKNIRMKPSQNRINSEMERLTELIVKEKGQDLEVEQLFELIEESYPDLKRYKSEMFKILAVLTELYNEQNISLDNRCQVSYQDIESCSDREEIVKYAKGIVRKIKENMRGKKSGSNHRVIKRLLLLIEEQYGDNVGLNEFASMLDMNPAYLSNLFREEVGVSYIKYLTDVRMKKAKELLNQGMKVADVSEKVGYMNYRYFCEIFKKHEGVTPNEYKGHIRKAGFVVHPRDTEV